MSDDRYNGWTNYETWNVALWMSNDEGSDSYWREAAEEIFRESEAGETYASQTRAESASYKLGERIKADHEEGAPTELVGAYADLMSAALSAVNWYEIAEHLIADLDTASIEAEEKEEREASDA